MNKSLDGLIWEYRHNAIEHGRATETGDQKKANKHHDRVIKALRLVREHGSQGDHDLLELLLDEDACVRCWAANHCLKVNEESARHTLEAVSALHGIIGFNARMVLAEWDRGTLKIL